MLQRLFQLTMLAPMHCNLPPRETAYEYDIFAHIKLSCGLPRQIAIEVGSAGMLCGPESALNCSETALMHSCSLALRHLTKEPFRVLLLQVHYSRLYASDMNPRNFANL